MDDKLNSINEVRKFWEENPLFHGELDYKTGTKEWFEEWEKVSISDCYAGYGPEKIYTSGLSKQSKILDVGCGPGFWVRYFPRNGFENLSACDLTQKAVLLAKESLRLFSMKQNSDFTVSNAEQLPYRNCTFDHINCQGVIHHTPNPQKCIEEFYRILNPGGTLCFSVYYKLFLLRHPLLLKCLCSFLTRFVFLKGRGRESMLSSGNPDEIVRLYDGKNNPIGMSFSKSEIQEMLNNFFEIKEVRRSFFPARAFPIRIPKIIHRWLHRYFGFMMVVRAVKIGKKE
jgi:ubiquinone/menaquinone biosynthesis C-methylase UbiE